MNVAYAMCASSGRMTPANQLDWFKGVCPVNRLQVCIVKATRVVLVLTGPVHAGLCNGLSRMKGNFHVRFLGEGAAATLLPYPTFALFSRGKSSRVIGGVSPL